MRRITGGQYSIFEEMVGIFVDCMAVTGWGGGMPVPLSTMIVQSPTTIQQGCENLHRKNTTGVAYPNKHETLARSCIIGCRGVNIGLYYTKEAIYQPP